MSTRSITTVRSKWTGEKDWETHANIYRHHDGYLEGQGAWLFEFLNGLKIINGIPGNPPPRYANGPGRLAAQLVAALQDDDHSPDLLASENPNAGQEYHYRIDVEFGPNGGTIKVAVFNGPMTFFGSGGEACTNLIFEGTVEEYGQFLKHETEEAEA